MSNPIQSLVDAGSKIWLDSVDPKEVERQMEWGISGATSNPIIISDLIKTGNFNDAMNRFIEEGLEDEEIAWKLTDMLVSNAQSSFAPIWDKTGGDDGWVSFELDPLLEDPNRGLKPEDIAKEYIRLSQKWGEGHKNRMIKVPNTPGGLLAIEEMVANGITLNITLTFSERQYIEARDAVWRGVQRRGSVEGFKAVYSIFVSRLDVYTAQHVPDLSDAAQGQVGIVNAKRVWKMNEDFWADKGCPLKQELIFASTGTKVASDPVWKYVGAFSGSGIETNPPKTNEAVYNCGQTFGRTVDQLPSQEILDEIDEKVDFAKLEEVLMREAIQKFADPQYALLKQIADTRGSLVGGS